MEATRAWRVRNPDYPWIHALLKRYGMTREQYDRMLEGQHGACAICLGVNPSGQRLAVDHNHDTGEVRALLCHSCNSAIGKLKDDPDLVERAAQYLRRFA